LTSLRCLEKKGVDLNSICISPSMFMLYGTSDNWFDKSKVSDDAEYTFNTQDGWDCDYPWGSFRDFDLQKYSKYLPFNERMMSKLSSIPKERYANALGVHYRGTDGVGHTEFVSVEKYLKVAEDEFSSGDYDCIFLATDQTNIVDVFKERFKDIKIYYYDHQRTMSSAGLHYSIQAQPNSPERTLAGDEVLIDATTLSMLLVITLGFLILSWKLSIKIWIVEMIMEIIAILTIMIVMRDFLRFAQKIFNLSFSIGEVNLKSLVLLKTL
jgi:hypothetical protein